MQYYPDRDYNGWDELYLWVSDEGNSGKCPLWENRALYEQKESCSLIANSSTVIDICSVNDPPVIDVPSP
eukprot:CAMPEP_0169479236 /NCGR_PEP_ID=MMETSP1042-20121227/28915_1 /TAXON_ID=464988 /ORGANISM="Hemiselmis andersenii, Strain CCMP1180" /LENGTH=69 /DNA_ID=CAMNT_0009593785 /DNA_START=1 /DNA_END=206 /DNA_ORIENTATION=+